MTNTAMIAHNTHDVYVAPPTPVGAWSMALGLRQRFEYYDYDENVSTQKCILFYCSATSLWRITVQQKSSLHSLHNHGLVYKLTFPLVVTQGFSPCIK